MYVPALCTVVGPEAVEVMIDDEEDEADVVLLVSAVLEALESVDAEAELEKEEDADEPELDDELVTRDEDAELVTIEDKLEANVPLPRE